MPAWGTETVCDVDSHGCVGLPYTIDPSFRDVNQIVGGGTSGACGAGFGVVTVPQGVTARIVVFEGPSSK